MESDSKITATSPAEAPGNRDIFVSGPGGTSAATSADVFTYKAKGPVVTGVSPSVGPTAGGTTVTITGSGFTNASAVQFGSSSDGPAATFTVASDTQITATSPAEVAGSRDVTVTGKGGTSPAVSADVFTYVAPPAVSGISPSSGPTAGGTTVTISGTGFSGATRVQFGSPSDGPPASFTVNSDSQITATSPAESAGVRDISITTVGGSSAPVAGDVFAYIAPPSVTGVNPSSGPTAGGTTVTITGTGLSGVTAVQFGASSDGPPASFTVNSDTQITATSPAESAGSRDVTVVGPGGTSAATAADTFRYIPPPAVTGISPSSGPAAGGTSVTITGTGFSGATNVQFGSSSDGPPASFTVNSDTQITATSPPESAGARDVLVTGPGGTSTAGPADVFTYSADGIGPITGLTITNVTSTSVKLSWTNPGSSSFAGVMIRRTNGSTPPSGPTSGVLVADINGTSFTDTNLAPGATYSYALFAHDSTPNYATAVTNTHAMPTTTGTAQFCGTITSDETWAPADAAKYQLSCPVTIPAGVTLTLDAGTTVDPTNGGLSVSGVVDAAGSSGSAVSLVATSGSWSFQVAAGGSAQLDHVVLGSAQVIAARGFSQVAITHSQLQSSLVSTNAPAGTVQLTGDGFSTTRVNLTGGSPVVQGDSWSGTSSPLTVVLAADLSGISGNSFLDGGLPLGQVASFEGDVTGAWTVDGGSSNQVTVFEGVSVDPGGSVTMPAGSQVKITGLDVLAGGSLVANGALLTTNCDNSVGGVTAGCGTPNIPAQILLHAGSNGASGGALHFSDTTVKFIQLGNTVTSAQVSWPSVDLADSVFSNGRVGLSSATLSAIGNAFANEQVSTFGGSPVVQGNSWSGTPSPLTVNLAADLSQVFGNTFTGGGIDQVAAFEGDVTEAWTVDGGNSGQVTELGGVSVDPGGSLTMPAGSQVKIAGVDVLGGGLMVASGALLTSNCDDSVGGKTTNCASPSVTGGIAIESGSGTGGGTFRADHTTLNQIALQGGTSAAGQTAWPTVDVTASTLTNGTIGFRQVAAFTASSDSFSGNPVFVEAGDNSSSMTITGNQFSGSAVTTFGGAPGIQDNSWSATPSPLTVSLATDLSRVFGNTFTGGGIDQVAAFEGDVTGGWTVDGGDSGQVTELAGVTVDQGGSMTLPVGSEVKVAAVDVLGGGLMVASGAFFTTNCDDSVGGKTTNCASPSVTGQIEVERGTGTSGGTFRADDSTFNEIALQGPNREAQGAYPTVDLTTSTFTNGTIGFGQVDAFTASNNTFSGNPVFVEAGDNSSSITLTANQFEAGSTLTTFGGAPAIQGISWSGTPNPLTVSLATDLSHVFGNTFTGGGLDQVARFEGDVTGHWTVDGGSSGQTTVLDGVTVDAGGTLEMPSQSQIKVGGVDVLAGGLAEADGALLTTVCDDTVGAKTANCGQPDAPGTIEVFGGTPPAGSPGFGGGSFSTSNTNVTYITLEGASGPPGQTDWPNIGLDGSSFSNGLINFDKATSFAATGDSFIHNSVQVGAAADDTKPTFEFDEFDESQVGIGGGTPVVDHDSWNDTNGPLTASSAYDLSNITDVNTATGPDLPSDATFTLSGSVRQTLKLAPASRIQYASNGITVESGGILTNDAGSLLTMGAITIAAGGEGDIVPTSEWEAGEVIFLVDGGGQLSLDQATLSGASQAIKAEPNAEVTVQDSTFSDDGLGINGDTDCAAGPTTVDVSGSTFGPGSGGITYCNTELYGYFKLPAVGNPGLTVGNVSTHTDTCVWAGEPAPAPDGVNAYPLDPIFDVDIGQPDAVCTGGYVKVVE